MVQKMVVGQAFRGSSNLTVAMLIPILLSGCKGEGAGMQGLLKVGQPCEITAEVTPGQGVANTSDATCPSQMCLKPSYQPGSAGMQDTGPYCSASCSQDGDCEGELRDPRNPLDKRCSKGFACGVPFTVGPLCCEKLCICKDFLGPSGPTTPSACMGTGAKTCAASTNPSSVEQQTDIYVDISPARQLDLVVMVDNSAGMAGKVSKMNQAFPKLIKALEDPTDRTLPDLHVAIIDSDLGTAGAYKSGSCAMTTLPDGTPSIFGDLGRFQMRNSPQACTFNDGALFLEHKAGQPVNYVGDISTVFSCLTGNLGEMGCGQEHSIQAFEFALVAQGVGNEEQQKAFLRSSAFLGLIFLTDEDDCSAATNDRLFGDIPEARGDSASLRCATRAHRCGGENLSGIGLELPGYPAVKAYTHAFADCEARIDVSCDNNADTSKPTECNPLREVDTFAEEIRSLKDMSKDQIVVAGIFGWPLDDPADPSVYRDNMAKAEYKIAKVPNPDTADTMHPQVYDYWPVCYDPDHLPSDAKKDPTTGFDAEAAAWGATGGLRNAAFVEEFGENGLKFSICQRDFSHTMTTIGTVLARKLQNLCVDAKLLDIDLATPGLQADCRVVFQTPTTDPKNPTKVTYQESPTPLPQCPPGATSGSVSAGCWQLVTDLVACPQSGQRVQVLRTSAEISANPKLPTGTKLAMQCRTCPVSTAGAVVADGCDY